MARVTEDVEVRIMVRISYEKKRGARDEAIKKIKMGVNTVGYSGAFGGFDVKSLPETLLVI